MRRRTLVPAAVAAAAGLVLWRRSRASAPHGAGRNYSRTAARKAFTLDDLTERMAGIEWSGSAEFIDEHPDAYKDIDVIMADAEPLVEKVHELRQVVSVKGD